MRFLIRSLLASIALLIGPPTYTGSIGAAPAEAVSGVDLASNPVLVSMGDSFASGEANPEFDAGTNINEPGKPSRVDLCHRSPSSFPRLLGATASTQIACSGAKIENIVSYGMISSFPGSPPDDRSQLVQLRQISASRPIRAVMVTIGGNDLDFAGQLASCYGFANMGNDCLSDMDAMSARVNAVTTRLRDEVYPKIREAIGPSIPIIVVGYPRLFPTNDRRPVNCNWLSSTEQERVNRVQNWFDSSTAAAVRDTGDRAITYVSVLNTSRDHELCTRDSWLYRVKMGCKFGDPEKEKSFCGHPLWNLHLAIRSAVKSSLPRTFDVSTLGCGPGCVVTGQVPFRHPSWGESILLTTIHRSGAGMTDGMIVVVDRDGRVRYRSRSLEGAARQASLDGDAPYGFGPVKATLDRTASNLSGNIFLIYNPGRYDGIIVLRPTSTGFDDFGSISYSDPSAGRFYDATVRTTGGQPAIVRWDEFLGCDPMWDPSCPDPHTYFKGARIVQWTGRGFAPVPLPDYSQRPCPVISTDPPFSIAGFYTYQATVSCAEVRLLMDHRSTRSGRDAYVTDGYVCTKGRHNFDPDSGDYFQCASGSRYVGFQYIA